MTIAQDAEKLKAELHTLDSTHVKIALFGQPGAGKSSLINELTGNQVALVGLETDTTKSASTYKVDGIIYVDLPGYGTEKFPTQSYFKDFQIESFDLFLCVVSGKVSQSDKDMFVELRKIGKTCLFVFNKSDTLFEKGSTQANLQLRVKEDIQLQVGSAIEMVFTSCKTSEGLDELVLAIERNLGDARKERWMRQAKIFSANTLAMKKEACEKYIQIASGISAVNGVNPVPGANIAVDVIVLLKLAQEIRDCYGFSETSLIGLKTSSIPVVANLANKGLTYLSKEGIMLLLKQYAGRTLTKQAASWVPVVGSAIAASLGFGLTYAVGKNFLEDYHTLAEEALKNHLSY